MALNNADLFLVNQGGESKKITYQNLKSNILDNRTDDENPIGGWRYSNPIKLCQQCPVKNLCLEFALVNDERQGLWGGMTPRDRAKLRRRQ